MGAAGGGAGAAGQPRAARRRRGVLVEPRDSVPAYAEALARLIDDRRPAPRSRRARAAIASGSGSRCAGWPATTSGSTTDLLAAGGDDAAGCRRRGRRRRRTRSASATARSFGHPARVGDRALLQPGPRPARVPRRDPRADLPGDRGHRRGRRLHGRRRPPSAGRARARADDVTLIRLRENGGPSRARNVGDRALLRAATCCPVDADNLLLPDAVEALVEQLLGGERGRGVHLSEPPVLRQPRGLLRGSALQPLRAHA